MRWPSVVVIKVKFCRRGGQHIWWVVNSVAKWMLWPCGKIFVDGLSKCLYIDVTAVGLYSKCGATWRGCGNQMVIDVVVDQLFLYNSVFYNTFLLEIFYKTFFKRHFL